MVEGQGGDDIKCVPLLFYFAAMCKIVLLTLSMKNPGMLLQVSTFLDLYTRWGSLVRVWAEGLSLFRVSEEYHSSRRPPWGGTTPSTALNTMSQANESTYKTTQSNDITNGRESCFLFFIKRCCTALTYFFYVLGLINLYLRVFLNH